MMSPNPADLLVIYGATGDLAQRMLLPALCGLERDGLLPDELRILCCARSDLDTPAFRERAAMALAGGLHGGEPWQAAANSLLERIEYSSVDLGSEPSLDEFSAAIKKRRRGEVLYHLSTAPSWYGTICQSLARTGLAGPETRVMLEKPIGHDLASAKEINDGVARGFPESRVFRVDHYLGKEGVQNLLALRFGNALFEPLWNARHIRQVQITIAETVGVEGRADYYDEYGATRDMVQNHLLQLLCLVAMEPPAHFDSDAVGNEKIKVLRSLRPIGEAELATDSVAGQYAAGAIDGTAVPGYGEEIGRQSRTETFVALRAHIDNWRWAGVPFYLRTGKRMPRRVTEIYIQFRPVPHMIFPAQGSRVKANELVIRLQPEERIALSIMNKTPGLDREGLKLSQVALDLDLHDAFENKRRRSAYERLYLDALEGNATLFVRRDEVEAAWGWVDGILDGWHRTDQEVRTYPAGSWGPSSAVALAERHGHSWRE